MLGDSGDSQSGSQKSISNSYAGSKMPGSPRRKGKRNRKSKRTGADSRIELMTGSRNELGLEGTNFIFLIKILGNIGQTASPKPARSGRVGSRMEIGLDSGTAHKVGSKDKIGARPGGGREKKSRMRGYSNEVTGPPDNVGSKFDFDDLGFAGGGEQESEGETLGIGGRHRGSNRKTVKTAGAGSTSDFPETRKETRKKSSGVGSPGKNDSLSVTAVVVEEEEEEEAEEEAEGEKAESEIKADSKRGSQSFFMSKAKAKYENMNTVDLEKLRKIKEERKPIDFES